MRYGTKHRTDFSWFSKGSVPKWNKVFFPFRSLIRPPNRNSARRQTGKGFKMKQNAFWNFRQQRAMEASGKRKRFRDRRPSKTIPASIGFLWTATVDTECFSSSNRATGLAFAWF
ncbi:MAG: hypothetical protein WAO21_05740 [Verrucomicrobiia bacterium]